MHLKGAAIKIKGQREGAITDKKEAFSINAPQQKAALIISFTGFDTAFLTKN